MKWRLPRLSPFPVFVLLWLRDRKEPAAQPDQASGA